ncbi:enoyl-CoA hydratase [Aeromicrobium choanae]|uniref:Enoyl-CoA hydratase n=1 Tax=Aeromicrobium choanae TaxID=1736691 RepID=A0A1T4YWL3_9ACTN|nr:enoyl-CoA hydratase [Aeromicrobium choanae]SKB06170.1 enoyl-CoA hydratase [Aeromicrobium choanae]
MTYRFIQYATEDEGTIATITLDRPRQRNAQHRGLLVELGDAFERAEQDDTVRVVILRGAGTAFSAGHDMGSADLIEEMSPGPGQHPTYGINGGTKGTVESTYLQEWHYFFHNTRRWRDLRKITIASVQGPVYSAGLMLMWACDLIVADETAVFADVVGTRLGMCGVEYFGHPWEFGPRKAKELLLTGDSLSVEEAHRLGMVSKVFPEGSLVDSTMALARRIAQVDTAAALMIKDSVNQTQDHQGFYNSLQSAFTLHQLNHARWAVETGGQALVRPPESSEKASSWNRVVGRTTASSVAPRDDRTTPHERGTRD